MYLRKPKSCVLLAVVYYAVVLAGMYAIARLQYRGVRWYPLLYLLLAGLPAVWVLFREKDLASVGIPKEGKSRDLLLAGLIVAALVTGACLLGRRSVGENIRMALYYLFCIALVEEMVYRGFLQSYLMGLLELGIGENGCYAIGGLIFSLAHIPFHMLNYDSVLVGIPQLVFAFVFHICMCRVADRRQSIWQCVAIHFAVDYVQRIV